MDIPSVLFRATEPWSSFYSDHALLQSSTRFLHLAGVLLGGGFAIATDKATLRAFAHPAERATQLHQITRIHRWVLTGLAITFVTGALMLAADLESLLASTVFWVKMGLIVLLLVNGAVLRRIESGLNAGRGEGDRPWSVLQITAIVSLALWFAVVFTGTLLVDAG